MSIIPDVRTDEAYNQNQLKENDKILIDGYDMAVDALEHAIDNLVEHEDTSVVAHLLKYNIHATDNVHETTLLDYIKDVLLNNVEMSRDMVVVSILDEYEEE